MHRPPRTFSKFKRWLQRLLRGNGTAPVGSSCASAEHNFIDLFVTPLEPRRVLNADFTLIGGVLDLTDFDGATTEVALADSVDQSSFEFTLDNGNWFDEGVDTGSDVLTVDKDDVTVVQIDDATAGNDVLVESQSRLLIDEGRFFDIRADLQNSGALLLTGGGALSANNITNFADFGVDSGSVVQSPVGGEFLNYGEIIGGGVLQLDVINVVSGDIDALHGVTAGSGLSIHPAFGGSSFSVNNSDSTSALTFANGYSETGATRLTMDIGGNDPGVDHDRVNCDRLRHSWR